MTSQPVRAPIRRAPSRRRRGVQPPSNWRARTVAGGAVAAAAATAGVALSLGQSPTSWPVVVGVTGVMAAVGALISERAPGNRMGWVLLAIGALLAVYFAGDTYVRLPGPPPGASLVAWAAGELTVPWFLLVAALLLLFPDGRLASDRWRIVVWLLAAMSVVFVVANAFNPGPFGFYPDFANPFGIAGFPGEALMAAGYLLVAVSMTLSAASLVARWRMGGVVERAQLKWVAAAGLLVATVIVGYFALFGTGYNDVADLAMTLAVGGFAVAIGVAILRYRLYEIDRLISRTLAYAVLTAILVAVYAAGILVFQALLAPFTAGGGPIAVAASTLAVFACFNPLRTRLQQTMDRRFNRFRYDAERTVEAFATRLRDETDLDRIRTQLAEAASSVLLPAHVSSWIRSRDSTSRSHGRQP